VVSSNWEAYARLDGDGGDLLDNVDRGEHVDEALVDAHFEAVPCCRALTTGGFAGGVAEAFRGHAHGSLDGEPFVTGALDEVVAYLLKILHLPACERDADALYLLLRFFLLLCWRLVCHLYCVIRK